MGKSEKVSRKPRYTNAIQTSYKHQNIFGANLAKLRKQHKLTQAGLAKEISEKMVLEEEISSLAISSYECGRRFPSIATLCAFAEYFEVSLDWLVGISDNSEIKVGRDKKKDCDISRIKEIDYDLLIRPQELKNYNQQAVFVEGKNNKNFISRWGLVDYTEEHQWIVFTNGYIELPASVNVYRAKPVAAERLSDMNMFPLSYAALTRVKFVYIEMLSSDEAARERYSGYYKVTEEKDGLMHVENGYFLPLIGLGKTFVAYSLDPSVSAI